MRRIQKSVENESEDNDMIDLSSSRDDTVVNDFTRPVRELGKKLKEMKDEFKETGVLIDAMLFNLNEQAAYFKRISEMPTRPIIDQTAIENTLMLRENYEEGTNSSEFEEESDEDLQTDVYGFIKEKIYSLVPDRSFIYNLNNEIALFRQRVCDGYANRPFWKLIVLSCGLLMKRASLFDLIYISVKYNFVLKLRRFKWLRRYFNQKYYTGFQTFNFRGKKSPISNICWQNSKTPDIAFSETMEILERLIIDKQLNLMHVVCQNDDCLVVSENLLEIKKKKDKKRSGNAKNHSNGTRSKLGKTSMNKCQAEMAKKMSILAVKNKIEGKTIFSGSKSTVKTYDCDAMRGTIYLNDFYKVFKRQIEVEIRKESERQPFCKNYYYFNSGRIYHYKEFCHIFFGTINTGIGIFNIYFITKAKNEKNGNISFEGKEILDTLNREMIEFFSSEKRNVNFDYISSTKPKFFTKSGNVKDEMNKENFYGRHTLLADEIESFMDYVFNDVKLKREISGIYFESFGNKCFTVTKNYFKLFEKLDRIEGTEFIAHFEVDKCITVSPKNMRPNTLLYQKIPKEFEKLAGSKGYRSFFSEKALCLNSYTSVLRPDKFKIDATGILKVNFYNGIMRLCIPDRIRKLKGPQLIISHLSLIVEKLSGKTRMFEKGLKKEIVQIRNNIMSARNRKVPFRNEVTMNLMTAPINLRRLDESLNKVCYTEFDQDACLNYVLEMVNSFEEILVKKKTLIQISDILRSIISEILVFERFFKGVKNDHLLWSKNFTCFVDLLLQKKDVKVYALQELVAFGMQFFSKEEAIRILRTTLNYSVREKKCKAKLQYFLETVIGIGLPEKVKSAVLKLFNHSEDNDEGIDEKAKTMPITLYIATLLEKLKTDATRLTKKFEEFQTLRFILQLNPKLETGIKRAILRVAYELRPEKLPNLKKTSVKGLNMIPIIYDKSVQTEETVDRYRFMRETCEKLKKKFLYNEKLDWSDQDFARLKVGLDKNGQSITGAYNDVRLGFYGIISKTKIVEAKKRLQMFADKKDPRFDRISEISEMFDVDAITFCDYFDYIKNRFKIELSLEGQKLIQRASVINQTPFLENKSSSEKETAHDPLIDISGFPDFHEAIEQEAERIFRLSGENETFCLRLKNKKKNDSDDKFSSDLKEERDRSSSEQSPLIYSEQVDFETIHLLDINDEKHDVIIDKLCSLKKTSDVTVDESAGENFVFKNILKENKIRLNRLIETTIRSLAMQSENLIDNKQEEKIDNNLTLNEKSDNISKRSILTDEIVKNAKNILKRKKLFTKCDLKNCLPDAKRVKLAELQDDFKMLVKEGIIEEKKYKKKMYLRFMTQSTKK
ncbi:hypothetical protein M153_1270006715 [Pseudoloma neurophilia]|uniref:Uncharacterized protein n=1 Tax=Pseudoloma neurophilia TaxID=146866 RepID=A0A0R0M0I9_9MICR|nr:hypothetical protein M153_1270006715 [Pseudoloma neurophilia]